VDARIVSKEVSAEEGQLVQGAFPLAMQPGDFQLTVHVSNLTTTYKKEGILQSFKEVLTAPEKLQENLHGIRIRQIIEFYGIEKTRQWFTMVYGWNFNQKVSKKKKVG